MGKRFILMLAMAGTILGAACTRIDVARIFEHYLWEKRVLLVFAPSLGDDRLQRQMRQVELGHAALARQDFVVWILVENQTVAVDGEAKPHLFTRPFYAHFHVPEKTFQVIVLDKDGEEALREQRPLSLAAILSAIDPAKAMPPAMK